MTTVRAHGAQDSAKAGYSSLLYRFYLAQVLPLPCALPLLRLARGAPGASLTVVSQRAQLWPPKTPSSRSCELQRICWGASR